MANELKNLTDDQLDSLEGETVASVNQRIKLMRAIKAELESRGEDVSNLHIPGEL